MIVVTHDFHMQNKANFCFCSFLLFQPDSLGPLDLDLPSTNKYHNEELILGDSLSSLNRLIASSLDAFQNCSFFGLDKKESSAFNS